MGEVGVEEAKKAVGSGFQNVTPTAEFWSKSPLAVTPNLFHITERPPLKGCLPGEDRLWALHLSAM